ncbi:MAG: iron-containing alcohol dehydrogenase [Euryarchaeota archaeon]|nr:iron-containing alcohol dehydrogenase [Euryarchaeota archaeon]
MWRFRSPRAIYFGRGSIKYLEGLEGKRAFVVTDPILKQLGIVDRVVEKLGKAGLEVRVFAEVEPNPSKETVERGAVQMREFEPDWIVGLGGGSSMDAAKAMWVFYERPDWTWKNLMVPGAKPGLRKKARLITIPTTSGTGSDVTWAFIITDTQAQRKMAFASSEVVADTVVLDAALAQKMPPRVTVDTGLDALTHAIESFVATLRSDFVDGLALRSAEMVMRWLPKAAANGNDLEAREHMHNAATIAGLAIGSSNVALAHALGHSLGATLHVTHGRSVGLLHPYVIQFNRRKKPVADLYGEVAYHLRVGETAEDLVSALRGLMKRVESPLALKEFIPRDDFDRSLAALAEKAQSDPCTLTNPVTPKPEEYPKLFQYAYEGKDVDF